MATTSRSEFSRPFQQRRKLRPMRPNPLMATFSFFSQVVTCLLPPVACTSAETVSIHKLSPSFRRPCRVQRLYQSVNVPCRC